MREKAVVRKFEMKRKGAKIKSGGETERMRNKQKGQRSDRVSLKGITEEEKQIQ